MRSLHRGHDGASSLYQSHPVLSQRRLLTSEGSHTAGKGNTCTSRGLLFTLDYTGMILSTSPTSCGHSPLRHPPPATLASDRRPLCIVQCPAAWLLYLTYFILGSSPLGTISLGCSAHMPTRKNV